MSQVEPDVHRLVARHSEQLAKLDVGEAIARVGERLAAAEPGAAEQVDLLVLALWLRVESVEKTVSQLKASVEALTERVNQNSQNSSKPPSTDLPGVKRKDRKKRSGRRRGGQQRSVQ